MGEQERKWRLRYCPTVAAEAMERAIADTRRYGRSNYGRACVRIELKNAEHLMECALKYR